MCPCAEHICKYQHHHLHKIGKKSLVNRPWSEIINWWNSALWCRIMCSVQNYLSCEYIPDKCSASGSKRDIYVNSHLFGRTVFLEESTVSWPLASPRLPSPVTFSSCSVKANLTVKAMDQLCTRCAADYIKAETVYRKRHESMALSDVCDVALLLWLFWCMGICFYLFLDTFIFFLHFWGVFVLIQPKCVTINTILCGHLECLCWVCVSFWAFQVSLSMF